MTYSIEIAEDQETVPDVAEMLRQIASKIEEGYTSGHYPSWNLSESIN